MAGAVRHRGPDGAGIYACGSVGLAHVRLSIIDVACGAQPLGNEDGQVLITFNGEVFNYLEMRVELEARGHLFRTNSDTETLVHAYEEWGDEFPNHCNGDFALAIYDRRRERVVLVRDRFGVRPLFYAVRDGTLFFASEVKSLIATGEVPAAPDFAGLDQVFTFWGARAPRTTFAGVSQLEPGTMAIWERGQLRIRRYYHLEYPEVRDESPDALRALDDIMRTSVSLRLRADVPVGGYLSGGLDSSITCALAAEGSPHDLRTFSITFADPRLDESEFQRVVAEQVKSQHAVTHIHAGDISRVFPQVVRHAETPMIRTAPAPMYLLAQLVRENGIKVVLTGEGADEVFMGYDLFKETSVRLFCLRHPESAARPRLFDRLYPYIGHGGGDFWRKFFLDAGGPDDPLFSHMPRFLLTSRIKEFYSPATRDALNGVDTIGQLRDSLPSGFAKWSPLNRAAYLEMTTLLSGYLLNTQGERMGMAHAVEGRFPFLDHRLFEYAAALPTSSKLLGLKEKNILKRWARDVIPPVVTDRHKQPYRAPDAPAFFGDAHQGYVDEMLSEEAIRQAGIFDPTAVAGLVRRGRAGKIASFAENQAFIAILSTQLWHDSMIASVARPSTNFPHVRVPVIQSAA